MKLRTFNQFSINEELRYSDDMVLSILGDKYNPTEKEIRGLIEYFSYNVTYKEKSYTIIIGVNRQTKTQISIIAIGIGERTIEEFLNTRDLFKRGWQIEKLPYKLEECEKEIEYMIKNFEEKPYGN
jgi:hypothetical protein